MPNPLLSRVFGAQSVFGQDSIYDTIRRTEEEDGDDGDLETRAGMLPIAHDEEFGFPNVDYSQEPGPSNRKPLGKSVYYQGQSHIEAEEVPASLLIEDGEFGQQHPMLAREPVRAVPAYGEPQDSIWTPHGLGPAYEPPVQKMKQKTAARLGSIDPKERALWKWTNVQNLDNFLEDVYFYYTEKGFYSIVLDRILNLLTSAFVAGFITVLGLCIDYSRIRGSKKLTEITVPHCMTRMSPIWTFLLWIFSVFWILRVMQLIVDLRKLSELRNFFIHLLDIPDSDIQTVSWPTVVERLMVLRDENPFTSEAVIHREFFKKRQRQRMDAHDIANRIMRRDNYLIALFNKDVLDLTIPLPFFRKQGMWLTKMLEFNLQICIIDFFIGPNGNVLKAFLQSNNRKALSDGLRRRFMIAGLLNIVLAPVIVGFSVVMYVLRYFNEFQKNPGQIGSRQYTPLAEWKFREFNELPHLFERRMNMSYPFASRYVDQFPKDKTVKLSRFVTFIAGSFAAVLAIASIIDTELVHLEITPERTVLFYIGLFGTILAVSRGMIPEENLVYDPEAALRCVIEYTHYLPSEWRNKLHSDEVKGEFMKLYDMKVSIFIQEMLSAIFLPFVLWFSLPNSSDKIIDFIREFTVHVDGIGYVCSFAVFDFKKNAGDQAPNVQEEFYASENKMISSYLGFMDNYGPNRTPNQGGKRNFPPAVSPQMENEMRGKSVGVAKQTARQAPRPSTGALRARGPYTAASSVTHSALLDKNSRPLSFSRRMRGTTLLRHESTADLKEEDEGEDDSSPFAAYKPRDTKGKQRAEERYTDEDGVGSSTSKDHYDTDLGDSFMSTGIGDGPDGDEDGQGSGPGPESGGVLNLIHQFQKAHGGKMVPGLD